jgi:hypothetical protein
MRSTSRFFRSAVRANATASRRSPVAHVPIVREKERMAQAA